MIRYRLHSTIYCLLTVFLLCAQPLVATQPVDPGAKFPEVVVKTVTENAYRGQWQSLSLDDGLLLKPDSGKTIHVSTDDLVRIETVTAPSNKDRNINGYRVQTIQRNTFIGRLAWSENSEKLRVISPDFGEWDVKLDDLKSIQKVATDVSDHIHISKWIRNFGDADNDLILTTNGDTISGFVAGMAPTGIIIDTGAGEATIAFAHLSAISLANPSTAVTSGKHFKVTLNGGSKVTTKHLSLKKNALLLGMPNGQQLNINPHQMRSIEVFGARWVWLSTLDPISDHHTPMLSLPWPMKRDSNVLGNPLKVSGESFNYGLGVHSRSSVSYDLRGQYTEFVTFFGLDDSAGSLADVDVHILVDGRRLYEKPNVTAGVLHGPIRFDIRQANHLELIVDFGERGDVQDRFNWIESALVR